MSRGAAGLSRLITPRELADLNAVITKGAAWADVVAALPPDVLVAGRDAGHALLRLVSGAFVEATLRDERVVRLEAHVAAAGAGIAARQHHTLERLVGGLDLVGQAVAVARGRLHAALGGLGAIVRVDRGDTSYALEPHTSGAAVLLVERGGQVAEVNVLTDAAAAAFVDAVRTNVALPIAPAGQA